MITSVEGLRHGQLVRSTSGRDQNQYYLILDLIGEKFMLLADGRSKTISHPKKKNIKHVQIIMLVDTEIENKLLKGDNLNDFQIVAAINRMKNEHEEGDRFRG